VLPYALPSAKGVLLGGHDDTGSAWLLHLSWWQASSAVDCGLGGVGRRQRLPHGSPGHCRVRSLPRS